MSHAGHKTCLSIHNMQSGLLKIKLNLLVKFIVNTLQYDLGSASFTMQVVPLHFHLYTQVNITLETEKSRLHYMIEIWPCPGLN